MTEHTFLNELKLTSIDEGCRQLADILGLQDPVSPDVLISAVKSEEYARNLLVCRGAPAFMKSLLENPIHAFAPDQERARSSVDLLKSVSASIVQWGKVGFSVASEETVVARLSACLACPDLRRRDAKAMIYEMIGTAAVCGLCGCDVEKKARMSSERCPGPALNDPTKNRWGQALQI